MTSTQQTNKQTLYSLQIKQPNNYNRQLTSSLIKRLEQSADNTSHQQYYLTFNNHNKLPPFSPMTKVSDILESHIKNKTENSSNVNSSDLNLEPKIFCRICLSSQKQEQQQLIVPCKCSGSLQFVHKNCYYKWIRHLYDRLESEEDKSKMENEGFQCEICKTSIKVQFEMKRKLVSKDQFGHICKNSIPLTITIIVFFMIAIAAFSYLVYFADMTKHQFEKENGSQAFFTVIGIIIVIVFFCAGVFIFVIKYLWIEKMVILSLKKEERNP